MIVGNLGFGTVEALNASIQALLGAMMAGHGVATGVGATIVPPTNDLASALATTKQDVNFAQFSSSLVMGFEQMEERVISTELFNTAQQVAEAGSVLGFGI